MDSSYDDFGYKELDDYIFEEFTDLSNLDIDDDEDADIIMMMSIQEELEKQEEHVSNFKVSIKRAGELFTWIESLA